MRPEAVFSLYQARERYSSVDLLEADEDSMRNYASRYVVQRPPMHFDHGSGIATIYVSGPMALGLAPFDKCFGGLTDYAEIEADIYKALADGASAILFAVDSPGGTVQGAYELALIMAQLEIPTAVATRGYLASAAYKLAVGCDYIAASYSSAVGSVGAFIPWVDKTAYWAAIGLKWEPVVSDGSPLKAMMAGPGLEAEHRQFLKEQLNEALSIFTNHIGEFRSVSADALRGQSLAGPQALAAALVDSVSINPEQAATEFLLSKISA
jgi:ClpP class serine protease